MQTVCFLTINYGHNEFAGLQIGKFIFLPQIFESSWVFAELHSRFVFLPQLIAICCHWGTKHSFLVMQALVTWVRLAGRSTCSYAEIIQVRIYTIHMGSTKLANKYVRNILNTNWIRIALCYVNAIKTDTFCGDPLVSIFSWLLVRKFIKRVTRSKGWKAKKRSKKGNKGRSWVGINWISHSIPTT